MSTPTSPNDPGRDDADRRAGAEPPRYGEPAPQYGQQPPQYGQQHPGDQPAGYGGYGTGPDYGNAPPPGYGQAPRNGLGIAALVFGIIALLGAWIPLVNIVSIVLAIVGIVLGIMALRRVKRGEATNRGMSITGLLLSVAALVLALVVLVRAANFIVSNYEDIESCADPALSQEEQQACVEEVLNS